MTESRVKGKAARAALCAVISSGLLALLLSRVDRGALAGQLAATDPAGMLLALAVLLAANVTQAARWQAVLRAWEVRVRLPALTRMVLGSQAFLWLLPATLGGDVARWALLSRQQASGAVAAQSVASDRLLGMAGLGLQVLVCLPWIWTSLPSGWLRAGLLLVAPACLLALGAVLAPRWVPARWRGRLGLQPARRPRWLATAAAMGALHQLVTVAAVVLLGRAAGDATSPVLYAALLPVVWLLSAVPVTVGGTGVREAGFVALFGAAGVPTVTAAAIASLWLLLLAGQALVGGLVLSAGRRRRPRRSGHATGDGDQGPAEPVVTAPARERGLDAGDVLAGAVEQAR